MVRPIVRYGATVLHEPARPVQELTGEVADLARDMVETMYRAPGVGLAAPQVGVPLRLFVVDITLGHDPRGLITLVNPEWVAREGMQLEEEGCLSVPGFNATVARPQRAAVKGLDLEGRERTYEAEGLLARAFQHEMDHLDGKVFLDRLRGIKRSLIVRRIRKRIKAGSW
ncbi:MAG: peptide deformylase [Acidobacteria bacterium]|nr:peptide deformylase [Acidobacteriota bacterium]